MPDAKAASMARLFRRLRRRLDRLRRYNRTARYREVREACLVANVEAGGNADLGTTARTLRTISGLYDQAARAASSL